LLSGEKAVAWAEDTPILVVSLDGELYALEDLCRHDEVELSSREIDAIEGSITCVLHGALRPT
jgi:3-phenylpropionate/trans-cinnamate dioxygenase ferredoxin component